MPPANEQTQRSLASREAQDTAITAIKVSFHLGPEDALAYLEKVTKSLSLDQIRVFTENLEAGVKAAQNRVVPNFRDGT